MHVGSCGPDAGAKIAGAGYDVLLVGSTAIDAFGFGLVRDAAEAVPGLESVPVGMTDGEETFVKTVSAGATGYVLKDAPAMDRVAAIRAVAQEESGILPRRQRQRFADGRQITSGSKVRLSRHGVEDPGKGEETR